MKPRQRPTCWIDCSIQGPLGRRPTCERKIFGSAATRRIGHLALVGKPAAHHHRAITVAAVPDEVEFWELDVVRVVMLILPPGRGGALMARAALAEYNP
jgi:hypothetical protein